MDTESTEDKASQNISQSKPSAASPTEQATEQAPAQTVETSTEGKLTTNQHRKMSEFFVYQYLSLCNNIISFEYLSQLC